MAKRKSGIPWAKNIFNPANAAELAKIDQLRGVNFQTVNEPLRKLMTARAGTEIFGKYIPHATAMRDRLLRSTEAEQALAMRVFQTHSNPELNAIAKKFFSSSYVEIDLSIDKKKTQKYLAYLRGIFKSHKKVHGVEKELNLGHAISASYAFTLGILLAKNGASVAKIGYDVAQNIGGFAEDAKYNQAKGRLVEEPHLGNLKSEYRHTGKITKNHTQRNVRHSVGAFWATVFTGLWRNAAVKHLENTVVPNFREDTGELKAGTRIMARRLSNLEGGEVTLTVPSGTKYRPLFPDNVFAEGTKMYQKTVYDMTLKTLYMWSRKHMATRKIDPEAYEVLINLSTPDENRDHTGDTWDQEIKIVGQRYDEQKKRMIPIWEAYNV